MARSLAILTFASALGCTKPATAPRVPATGASVPTAAGPTAALPTAAAPNPAAATPDGGPALPPGIEMHRIAAGTPDATGWYSAHSTNGQFTVLLPAPFNDFTGRDTTDHRGAMVTYAVGTQLANGVKFSAFCFHGGPAPDPSFAAMAKLDGVTARRELVVDGHPAVELTAGTIAMIRAIAYADHVCTLIVESQTQPATVPVPVNDARRMFDSFHPDLEHHPTTP